MECISESVYENPLLIVSDAIRVVNRRIYEKSQDYEEYRGMGTTLTLAFVDEASKLHVFQVGDSRLYLISDTIRQITKDHSYVEEMYRKGLITRDSEEYQSKKNIIREHSVLMIIPQQIFLRNLLYREIYFCCARMA